MSLEYACGNVDGAKREGMMQTREQKAARLAELKASLLCVEGTPTEVYSRIVGYYRSVRNWNAGKREEFKARAGYSFPVATDQRPAELSSYVLFTRQTCPNCPAVKEFLAASGLPGILIDVDTETGLDAARRYEVLSTPTAIMLGEDGEERCRAYSKSQAAALLVQSQTQETTHPTAALQTA